MENQNCQLRKKLEDLACEIYDIGDVVRPIQGFAQMIKTELHGPINNQNYTAYIRSIHAAAQAALERQKTAQAILYHILGLCRSGACTTGCLQCGAVSDASD